MRDILFRGKPIGENGWIYGDLIHRKICGQWVTIIREEIFRFDNYEELMVDPKTVCQYTGVKDKTGKEVFECDIVQYKGYNTIVRFGESGGLGLTHNIGFYLDWDDMIYCSLGGGGHGRDLGYWLTGQLEVVGDIFDNPKKKEKK